jgi:hypothetical protein
MRPLILVPPIDWLTHFGFAFSALETSRWEQWILRVVVNNTPRPISNDSAAVIERQRIQVGLYFLYTPSVTKLASLSLLSQQSRICLFLAQDTAEGMLRGVLLKIFEVAGESLDHIPPVMYEFVCSPLTAEGNDTNAHHFTDYPGRLLL